MLFHLILDERMNYIRWILITHYSDDLLVWQLVHALHFSALSFLALPTTALLTYKKA
jgi:hypothetical protein